MSDEVVVDDILYSAKEYNKVVKEIDYFEHPAINHSKIKDIDISERYYYKKHVTKEYEEESNDNYIFGSLVHCMLLEEDKIQDNYLFIGDIDKRTKEYKELVKTNLNKIIIKESEYELAKIIINAIKNNKFYNTLLKYKEHIITEMPIYWFDDETGLQLKAKPDFMIAPIPDHSVLSNGLIVDLKTTTDITKYQSSIVNFKYYSQASWYCEAYKQHFNTTKNPYYLILFVEKNISCHMKWNSFPDYLLKMGDKLNRIRLSKLNTCLDTNIWNGLDNEDKPVELELLPWQIKEINKLLGE